MTLSQSRLGSLLLRMRSKDLYGNWLLLKFYVCIEISSKLLAPGLEWSILVTLILAGVRGEAAQTAQVDEVDYWK